MAMDKTQPKSAAPSQPKPKPAPAASGSARPFLLRKRQSPQVLRCPDLATLRQWSAEKRLTRDDEVSRSGQKWRKMGTIVEFESLFYSVDQERLARRKAQAAETPAAATATPTAAAEKPTAPTAAAEKPESAPAEKPVIGTLKVTPPGLNQVSGNLSLMRLARPGSGKGKPAPTPPGLSGSAAAAKRAASEGGKGADSGPQVAAPAVDPARAEAGKAPAAKPAATKAAATPSESQTAVFKRDRVDEIVDNDETRRIEPDSKATAKQKPSDPIEDALKKNDPVPRALTEARDVTQKIPASEPDEYEQIERQAARRRNGILLLVAGGAALGLYYLLGSDQPPTTPTTASNPPGIEHKTTETSPTASQPTTAPKPIVEPLAATPPTTGPAATAPTTTPQATAPAVAAVPTPSAPVGPAPAPTGVIKPPAVVPAAVPTVTPLGTTPPPGPATATAPTTAPTAATAPAVAVKPQAPAATAPAAAVKPPATTPAATATTAPATAPAAAGTKITSDEVRRIIDMDIPKTFDGQIELANKFFERGKYPEALAVYQLMLTYAPNVPAIHKALGDIAFERNQPDLAIEHYNTSLQIRPSYSAAEFGLGKTYHRLKNDKDQALAHYLKYLEINPKGSAAPACRDGITKLGGTVPAPPPP